MPSRDYEEFIAALNARGVRYLIVGAHAVAHHARPRATKDLDVVVGPSRANVGRLIAALGDFFDGADLGYRVEDFTDPRTIIQLGVAPTRIDLMTAIEGRPRFDAIWQRRVDAVFGAVPAHYIGLSDLIAVKSAAKRPQDRADLRVLKRTAAARGV